MSELTRRQVVAGSLALPLAAASSAAAAAGAPAAAEQPNAAVRRPATGPRVVVVGAGAFGGWSALALARRGARVTLVDAWGAGNSRSSSGGETRVIRGMYGPDRVYVDWVVRSFELWRAAEREWGEPLLTPTGTLWMFQGDDAYARSSLPLLAEAGLPARTVPLAEARRRWPQVDFTGIESVYTEDEAGVLAARRACASVARAVVAAGGEARTAAVAPDALALPATRTDPAAGPPRPPGPPEAARRLAALTTSDGARLEADAFVFACGPWLGSLLPDLIGARLRPSRQEVFYFGVPAGDRRFAAGALPVWIDFGERIFYGLPETGHRRGFKVADDTRGVTVEPTTAERAPSAADLERAREALARRFPALAGAPLLESRVCQYANTPDGHLLLDRHPDFGDVVVAGGGSGHGFKLAPAIGEHVADLVLGGAEPLSAFSLARLAEAAEGRTQFERGGEG